MRNPVPKPERRRRTIPITPAQRRGMAEQAEREGSDYEQVGKRYLREGLARDRAAAKDSA